MLWPKKNSYKEFDNEKKFLRLENSTPPKTFLMVRPLSGPGSQGPNCSKSGYSYRSIKGFLSTDSSCGSAIQSLTISSPQLWEHTT